LFDQEVLESRSGRCQFVKTGRNERYFVFAFSRRHRGPAGVAFNIEQRDIKVGNNGARLVDSHAANGGQVGLRPQRGPEQRHPGEPMSNSPHLKPPNKKCRLRRGARIPQTSPQIHNRVKLRDDAPGSAVAAKQLKCLKSTLDNESTCLLFANGFSAPRSSSSHLLSVSG